MPVGERYDKILFVMFIPPGASDAFKWAWRRVMRLIYPELYISERIVMTVVGEATLSVSRNEISPFSLKVENFAPCELTVQLVARMLADDGTDLAPAVVEEPWQTVAKSKNKTFTICPLNVVEPGRQRVAAIRSKSMTDPDYMDVAVSVTASVKTSIYSEIQISRSLPVRVRMTN
jgi:hypothetical protein